MVYVPDPSEREDMVWFQQGRKKKEKAPKQEVVPPGPVTMVGNQPVPVVLVQPGAEAGGQAAAAPASAAAPVAAAAAAGAAAGAAAAAASAEAGKKEKESNKIPKGGRYILERHFGVLSCCCATLSAGLCTPCICRSPLDIRTVYIVDGVRYNKIQYSLSCGGCGCLCC